ncbi:MAG: hypothetical protein ACLTT1_08300 [[Clostridium] scindens]
MAGEMGTPLEGDGRRGIGGVEPLLRNPVCRKVDGLLYVLRRDSKDGSGHYHGLCMNSWCAEDLQLKLRRLRRNGFQAAGELAPAKEYAQVYRILIQLFEKFVELLGDEPVALEEYGQLLDAGLEEVPGGRDPSRRGSGGGGDMERTRLKDMKALFFIGANDVHLPGPLMRTGLLSERDREVFVRERLTLAPGGKEQAYIQKFYLYMNLTKPSGRLRSITAKVSADGKEYPSVLSADM